MSLTQQICVRLPDLPAVVCWKPRPMLRHRHKLGVSAQAQGYRGRLTWPKKARVHSHQPASLGSAQRCVTSVQREKKHAGLCISRLCTPSCAGRLFGYIFVFVCIDFCSCELHAGHSITQSNRQGFLLILVIVMCEYSDHKLEFVACLWFSFLSHSTFT